MKRTQEKVECEDDQLLHHMRTVKASATIQKMLKTHQGKIRSDYVLQVTIEHIKHLVL